MIKLVKSAMMWRFLGGFAAGAIGVLTLHPAVAEPAATQPATAIVATR